MPVPSKDILYGHCRYRSHDLLRIISSRPRHRMQIAQNGGIGRGVRIVRDRPPRRLKSLRPRSSLAALVPVPRCGKLQIVRGGNAQAADIAREHNRRNENMGVLRPDSTTCL
jgi:hypothetical protein